MNAGNSNGRKIGEEPLWKISTDERFQIWHSGSTECYLAKPTKFMPKRFLNSGAITAPKELPINLTGEIGVESAGFVLHKKGYYLSRCDRDAIGLIFVLGGRYRIRSGSDKFDIKKGMLFVAPAGTVCGDGARGGDVRVLWFRMMNTPYWRGVFGGAVQCRQARHFKEIVFMANMYADEVYSPKRSVLRLRNILRVLAETISLEFRDASECPECETLEKLVLDIQAAPFKKATLAKASKKSGIGQKRLNALFEKNFGCTYSKFILKTRMEKTQELMARGLKLKEIANLVGFADGYSLSNAFKGYYKMSPRKFMSKVSRGES